MLYARVLVDVAGRGLERGFDYVVPEDYPLRGFAGHVRQRSFRAARDAGARGRCDGSYGYPGRKVEASRTSAL